MINWNNPVQTKEGKRVRILCTDRKGDQPIIGIITDENGTEWIGSWGMDGKYYTGGSPSGRDLVNVPLGKYRVALFNTHPNVYYTSTMDDARSQNEFEQTRGFVRWLTDWIDY